MALTKEQKEKYVFSGSRCPYCHTDNIQTTEQVQTDGGCAWQNVICNKCGKEWRDVYKLVDIEEEDE